MSDQRVQYDEERVGAGHPTKSDTLNRLALVETDTDGKGKYRYFKEQTSDPSTDAGELAVFCKDDGEGNLKLYMRGESDGDVSELISASMEVVQSGETTLTGGSQTETITITEIDSIDDHFVMLRGHFDASHNSGVSAVLTSTTQITVMQISDDQTLSANAEVFWDLVKLSGLCGAIRQGIAALTINLSNSLTWQNDLDNISITDLNNDGADYSKSILYLPMLDGNQAIWGSGTSKDDVNSLRLTLTSNTNIAVDAYGLSQGAAATGKVGYVVIPVKA